MINKIKYIIFYYVLIISFIVACPSGTNCFAPDANAGEDKIYYIGSTVTFDGSNSSDPEGAILSYDWKVYPNSQLLTQCQESSDPATFMISVCLDIFDVEIMQEDCNENGLQEAFVNACNSSDYSDILDCATFEDSPPPSDDCTLISESFISTICDLALDSYSGDADFECYDLYVNSDNYVTLDNVTNPTFDLNQLTGNILATLVVNDGDYNSNIDDVLITIVEDNHPPIIDVVSDLTVNKISEFTLDASMTNDDSSLTGEMIFLWEDVSDVFEIVSDNLSTITYLAPNISTDQSYEINLTVSDGIDSNSETIIIEVLSNQIPIAIPGQDQLVKIGSEFTLDGSRSYDPDDLLNANLEFHWDIPLGFTIVTGTINDAILVIRAPIVAVIGEEAIISLTVNDGTANSAVNIGEEIFISEYCEHPDDADGRYFEIYNPTDQMINLDQYELWRLSNGGNWNEGSFSLSGYVIQSGEAIAITRKDDSNTDASELIDFDNITDIHWSSFNPGGNDAIGIAKNGILIDAMGGTINPGTAWNVAGYIDATKDSQLIRKDTIVGGNINSTCMAALNENEDCWNISMGTTPEDSEWIYYENSINENPSIPDVDSFNNAGYHYCATCENYLVVTLTDNAAPVALMSSDFEFNGDESLWIPAWDAYEGSSIMLDATSSYDPEGTSLTYRWTSSIVSSLDNNTLANPVITIPFGVPDNFINDIILTVDDGVNEASIAIGIYINSINGFPVPQIDFVSMNNGEFSQSMNSEILDLCTGIATLDTADGCAGDQDCLDECILKNIILDTQIFDLNEGYTVVFSSKNSYDVTYTGTLTFVWDIDEPSIDLEGYNTDTVSFVVPEYIDENQAVKLTLSADDGELSASIPSLSAEDNIAFIARMPILSVSDEHDGSTKIEGDLLKLDASDSNDPLNLNLDDLYFEITSTPSLDIIGYCYNDDSISCIDEGCDNAAYYCLGKTLNSNQNINNELSCCQAGCDELTGNNLNTCLNNCSNACGVVFNSNNEYEWTKCASNKSISYTYMPKSIGASVEYQIDFNATKIIYYSDAVEEILNAVSDNILITVNALDPVAVPGYRIEEVSELNINTSLNHVSWYDSGVENDSELITELTEVILDGTRSYDPQLQGVSSSYWDDNSWVTVDNSNALKMISYYDASDGLIPRDGYTYQWTQTFKTEINEVDCQVIENDYVLNNFNDIANHVSPRFIAPELNSEDDEVELHFDLVISDGSNISETSSISITIIKNDYPTARIGDVRIYNEGSADADRFFYGNFNGVDSDGDSEGNADEPNILRAYVGSNYTLIGENSYDNTPYTDLTYSWTNSSGDIISDDMNPTITIPSDLCSDGVSLTEIKCCESNSGTWSANQQCLDGQAEWSNEKQINYLLEVNDGELSSQVSITLVYSSFNPPEQPSLYSTAEHGKINLYWDNIAEDSIDKLTKYADFEGYKIYKSNDYGQSWGDAIFSSGEPVGWRPYAQFDFSAEQDSIYCLYKNDFQDCIQDSQDNIIPQNVSVIRYDDVSGNLDWSEGYYWQNLGSNSGLTQSFIDEDVIDGVDYTYSITAYDRGVRPDTLQYGQFGELKSSSWNEKIWVNDKPIYIFKEVVEVDSFYFHKMNYNILESYINDSGKYMYNLEIPSSWAVGESNELVSQAEIDEGLKIWDTNTVYPISNPDEFPSTYSLETRIGSTIADRNLVTVSPGFPASNVSFPQDSELDRFIAADCEAVGDGNRYYEIVNTADLTKGYIKLEIEAKAGGDVFENYKTEEACLYAYRVEKIDSDFSPIEYMTLERPDDSELLDGYLIKYVRSGANNYFNNEGVLKSLNEIKNLPGFSQDDDYAYLPDYLIECHELSYLDDPDVTQNWTTFFDGVRMRFDNSLRDEPKGLEGAALKDVYSVFNPNEATPDSSFAKFLIEGYYGKLILKYAQGAFAQKPSYEYEVEFYHTTFPDTARFNTTGGNVNDFYHLDECGTTFGTLLPFTVKNTTTGKFVKIAHTDEGIWNTVKTEIPSSFATPDDFATHPGFGDCVWSPGENLEFKFDDVIVGNAEETEEVGTFILQLKYDPLAVNYYKSALCPNISEYDQTTTYASGSCTSFGGNVWYASVEIKPSDNNAQGYTPNEWYADSSSELELNINPWKVIYPWNDGDKLIIKPQKWFVDGDYWIADMSMLGTPNEVSSVDIQKISVVPNPYIVSSKFNEDVNANRIRFTHLPQKCKISIFTISGELVQVLNHQDDFDGNKYWDLKNSKNKKVAPGLYIYKVEVDNGISKIGKFAIVR